MRCFALYLGFSLFSHALADKRIRTAPIKSANQQEAPGVVPGDGSLWDFIDGPADAAALGTSPNDLGDTPTQSDNSAVGTLSEMDAMEPNWAIDERPSVDFYIAPLEVLELDPLRIADINPADFDIPIVINDDVKRWMNYYIGKGRKNYTKWLERKGAYEDLFLGHLTEAQMPSDLMYLSMIESGYKTHAYSHASAAGLWQFISPTAKEWGLRVDWWVDERRSPEDATKAATKFLGYLYKRYGDWYLAWAAYNGGPGRVDRAIKAHGTKDFWTLVEKNAFPAETDNYVPKLIAAAIVGQYAERYGFVDIETHPPFEYDTVEVDPSIGLDVLARCAGTTTEKIKALNPQLRRWALPPSPTKQVLRVPKDQSEPFLAALAKVPKSERLSFQHHTVVKGENLGIIATRYGVQTSAIQKANQIQNPNRISVGMKLIIPAPGYEAHFVSTAGTVKKSKRAKQVTHIVRSGETVSTIAEKYKVKQADLMKWNGVKNADRIKIGQKLKLYEPASQWASYTVRSGDTLSQIAEKNNCSVSDIKSWNHMKTNRIYAGQKLKIRRG